MGRTLVTESMDISLKKTVKHRSRSRFNIWGKSVLTLPGLLRTEQKEEVEEFLARDGLDVREGMVQFLKEKNYQSLL